MKNATGEKIRVLGINRHRMKTDGKGITTLVALPGCPLSCRYCINAWELEQKERMREVTVEELAEELAVDHCYFVYTNGGVTFGGGEPLLQSQALLAFSESCPKEWQINIETSLNVPPKQLKPLLNERFSFIIDVKTMDSDIYRSYTGKEQDLVLQNIASIAERIPDDQYVIKVPEIPEYTTGEDVEKSCRKLFEKGIQKKNIVTFSYVVNNNRIV